MFFSAILSLATAERVGSFIVLGDWGYASWSHCAANSGCGMSPQCQQNIGNKMKEWVQANPDVKFVLNVGDSFYPNGVSSPTDSRWQSSWKDVYGSEITNLKWYSVYGNHDYEGQDYCACADPHENQSVCAQLNGMAGQWHSNLGSPTSGWQMPNNYYYNTDHLADLGIEIVAMDTNSVAESACHYLPRGCSSGSCWANLNARYSASMDLFSQRMKATQADNVLVFNHYPSNYFGGSRYSFINALKQGAANDAQLHFFGGHTHYVKEGYGIDISPAKQWLVGGGGGWGCDSWEQGFAVGIINKDTNGKFTISMESQLVSPSSCCYHHSYEEANTAIIGSKQLESQLKENGLWENTCGGLECEERQEALKNVRKEERLQGASTESTPVKEALAEQAERESGANFEPSKFFKDTIEEIRKIKAARGAAASHAVQVE